MSKCEQCIVRQFSSLKALNKEELCEGFKKIGMKISKEEIDEIIKKIEDCDHGKINYSEFLFAAMDFKKNVDKLLL